MSRSQRHRVIFENYAATGSALAEGAVAPGYSLQPGPVYAVPMGPAGGPLQGSSLSGPVLAGMPTPRFDNPLAAALIIGKAITGGTGPVNPPEGADPILAALSPATAELGSGDIIMICQGSNFTPSSVIHFAEHDEPTTFVDAHTVTTGVKPSLGWGPGPQPVYVKTGGLVTDTLEFTFTEAPPAKTTKSTAKKGK